MTASRFAIATAGLCLAAALLPVAPVAQAGEVPPVSGVESLGLAARDHLAAGGRIAFAVEESAQDSTDLNGDGDDSDFVMHVYDPASGVTNLRVATHSYVTEGAIFDGDLLAFRVHESDQGADFNGDGDSLDKVPHVYDFAERRLLNTRLAGGFNRLAWDSVAFESRRLAVAVEEAAQGGVDLNGDDDTNDTSLHIVDLDTGSSVNLGLSVYNIMQADGTVLFSTYEAEQGNSDLNGDGDADDDVLFHHDFATGLTENLGVSGRPAGLDDGLAALVVQELRQGNEDLNGDGDTDDWIAYVHEAGQGLPTSLGLASAYMIAVERPLVASSADVITEGGQGLNGDPATHASLAFLHDVSSGVTRILSDVPTRWQGRVVLKEGLIAAQGVDTIRLFDPSDDSVTLIGPPGELEAFQDDTMLVSVWESAVRTDLNHDGDDYDLIPTVYDVPSGQLSQVLLDGRRPLPYGRTFSTPVAVIEVSESGSGSADLNGDGDTQDSVVHVYNAVEDSTINLGLASSSFVNSSDGLVSFVASESFQGQTDLNGDGDAADTVIHVMEFATEAPTPAPVVTSVSPDEFSIYQGGTAVITGTDFVDVTGVSADGMSIAYSVVSPSELRITVPPRVVLGAATAALIVTTSHGSSAQSGPTIRWIAPPVVNSVSGNSGVGGPAIIDGQQLTRVTAVTVDSRPIPFTVLSDQQISITLPRHAPGFVDVVVRTSLYEADGWTRYYDPPAPATLPAQSEAYSMSGSYIPLVGDFDGNQVDDVFWYAPGAAPDYLWRFTPDGRHTSVTQSVNGTYRPTVGDFGFDGVDDIVWYAPGNAADTIWDFDSGGGRTSRTVSIGGDYTPIVGDFTGDSSDDVVWYARGSTPDPMWVFTYGGNGSHTVRPLSVTGTYRPVAGDFTGDGVDDIAWYAPGSTADSTWDFNVDGTRTTRPLSVQGTYNPIGGDFTRDGVDDILWYAPGTANDTIWDFNPGGSYTNRAIALTGTWRIASGDLTGGGVTDLALHGPGTAPDAIWFLSAVVR